MADRSCILESIVVSLDDARVAAVAGADRFELCSALALGGLTPSTGLLAEIKDQVDIPVMCMIRPREGGMAYSKGEFQAMLRDAEILLDFGADGLVFGFLKSNGDLDSGRLKTFMNLLHRHSRSDQISTTFHRAFDVVNSPSEVLEVLIDMGVDRVLTSGRAATALEGVDQIREYRDQSGGRIGILPGGGITLENLSEVVCRTGTDQVHVYLSKQAEDLSPSGNPAIYFGAHLPGAETEYQVVDGPSIVEARRRLP